MKDDESTPIESALNAERAAREAVEQARAEASRIRQDAREQARRIEQRADERTRRLHARVDEQLESTRNDIEREGAQALRRLRRNIVDETAMKRAIDELVIKILTGED